MTSVVEKSIQRVGAIVRAVETKTTRVDRFKHGPSQSDLGKIPASLPQEWPSLLKQGWIT